MLSWSVFVYICVDVFETIRHAISPHVLVVFPIHVAVYREANKYL